MDRRGLDIEREVDSVCDRFEALLKGGHHPDVDAFLSSASPAAIPTLTMELLRLAVEYAGTQPSREAPLHASPKDASTTIEANAAKSASATIAPTDSDRRSEDCEHDVAIGVPIGSPRQFEDYELLEVLGAGGMGTVYRAHQKSVSRTVAVKILHPDRWNGLSSSQRQRAVERFLHEACAAARHEHPNVITVYEGGVFEGEHFLAMQYVDGQSLAQLVREAPFDNRRAAAYLEPVCRGLHAVHSSGVLHRDIKPSNILVERHSDRPLLTDFGLAKVVDGDRDLTLSGDVFGSPPYMPPEQIADASHVSVAADVYGIGATLYHLLTGRPPIQAATVAGTLHQVLSTEPVSPRLLNPAVDRDIETICLKCLEKRPSQRYSDALAVAKELQRYLAGHPIEARPITWIGRTIRWCRRRPSMAALIAALAATLFAAFVAVTLLYTRARDAAEYANAMLSENERQLAQVYQRSANLEQWPPSSSALAWIVASLPLEKEPQQEFANRVRIQRLLTTCPELVQQVNHSAPISAAVFSPDGRTFVTGGTDGTARLWPTTGALTGVRVMEHADNSAVLAACFSADGKMIATGGADGRARLWSAITGTSLVVPLAHDAPVCVVTISPDCRLLATGSVDRTVRIWDTATGEPVGEPLLHDGVILALTFTPSSQQLATADANGDLSIWSISSGERTVHQQLGRHQIKGIALDRSGEELITIPHSGDARVCKTGLPSEAARTIASDGAPVVVRTSADADVAMIATNSGQILHWQTLASDAPISQFHVGSTVQRADLSSDGTAIALATGNKEIEIWTCDTLEPASKAAVISTGAEASLLSFGPDSGTLLAAHGEHARLWAIHRPPDPVHELATHGVNVAWHARKLDLVLAAQQDGQFQVLNVGQSGGVVQSLQHQSQRVLPLDAFCKSHFVFAESKGIIKVLDLAGGSQRTIACHDLAPLAAIAMGANGHCIAVANREGRLRIITDDEDEAAVELGQRPSYLAVDKKGETVLAICRDRLIRVSARTRDIDEEIISAGHVAISATTDNGSVIVVDSGQGMSRIAAERFALPRVASPRLPVEPEAIWPNRNGTLCAVATTDNNVRVFEVDGARALAPAMSHSSTVQSACFSDSDGLLATLCDGGMVRVWDVHSSALVFQARCRHSPPIRIWFGEGDRQVLAFFGDGHLLTVEVKADRRDIDEINRDARLISGHRVDHTGTLAPVTLEELDRDWANRRLAR